jgi:ABA sandwich protein
MDIINYDERALDALVAERIFGWRWMRSSVSGRQAIFPMDQHPEWFTAPASRVEGLANDWDCRLPHYSTDMAAAWLVVEKLKKAECRVIIRATPNDCGYDCEIEKSKSDWWSIGQESAPIAICQAALKFATGQPDLTAKECKCAKCEAWRSKRSET